MKKRMFLGVLSFIGVTSGLALFCASFAQAGEVPTREVVPVNASSADADVYCADNTESGTVSAAIRNHLELGTRVTYFRLIKDNKNSFLGTIDHLAVEQDYLPLKLFGLWTFNPMFGVELTWDDMTADAATSPTAADGKFKASGPIISGVIRFMQGAAIQPYGFAGLAWMFGSFDAQPWWGDGYHSEADWEAESSTTASSISRHMDIKASLGVVVGGGADYRLGNQWALDAYVRYMSLHLDDHYYIDYYGQLYDDRGVTRIPFDNVALGLGIKYVF